MILSQVMKPTVHKILQDCIYVLNLLVSGSITAFPHLWFATDVQGFCRGSGRYDFWLWRIHCTLFVQLQ